MRTFSHRNEEHVLSLAEMRLCRKNTASVKTNTAFLRCLGLSTHLYHKYQCFSFGPEFIKTSPRFPEFHASGIPSSGNMAVVSLLDHVSLCFLVQCHQSKLIFAEEKDELPLDSSSTVGVSI